MESDQLVGYAVVFLLAVILAYFLYRWIFSVDKHLKYQEMQIKLLREIALKLGAADADVKEIVQPKKTGYWNYDEAQP